MCWAGKFEAHVVEKLPSSRLQQTLYCASQHTCCLNSGIWNAVLWACNEVF